MFFYFDQKWEVLDSISNTIRILKVDDTHVTNFDGFVWVIYKNLLENSTFDD